MTMTLVSDEQIKEAADILRHGRLVAFPTETVYGLGVDAASEDALRLLYQVKGRPTDHPVIVHIAAVSQLTDWAKNIPPVAYKLAETFWPGPMTLILPRAEHISDLVTGGQSSVGLRIPSHPVALRLLQSFGGGVAAPSANRFGRLSPTTAQAVRESLGSDVDLVLDGGACPVGIESTIVSLLGERPAILRPGMINREQLEAILGGRVDFDQSAAAAKEMAGEEHIRVPGGLESHYAPRTPMLVAGSETIIELFGEGMAIGRSLGVIASPRTVQTMRANFGEKFYSAFPLEAFVTAPATADEYARMLYDTLRKMDQLALHKILVESVPAGSAWDGVRDRLTRASAEQRSQQK